MCAAGVEGIENAVFVSFVLMEAAFFRSYQVTQSLWHVGRKTC